MMPSSIRKAMCRLLRGAGVDPDVVPEDSYFHVDLSRGRLRFEAFAYDADGQVALNDAGTDAAREPASVRLPAVFPAICVLAWIGRRP